MAAFGEFGMSLPFTFRGGILVDANGWPVPRLPKVEQKPTGFVPTGRDYGAESTERKFNPFMVTSDFSGREGE